ncbi:hypothetical protein NYP18_15045 [Corynebacterium sp. YIM 101645]|uniref:Uncharacterized protein n=1 Tax=Corynebacterium lemuris TaxID=1859292 RepID=A0ABT2G0C8_9CORY|nr:hypothetical protein [Corynebacterium lemuris]MCS5480959.1 hypothetical protein [Corynebacterium lemuris]
MQPYYPKQPARMSSIMAEQNRNGTWSTESRDPTHDIIPDHVFHDMFTDQPPHEFTKMDGSGEVVDPVALAEAGTHELVYCTTKEHLDQIAEEHPATWFLDMDRGGAQQRRQIPSVWVGQYRPGQDLMREKDAVYGFPLLAVVPKK